MKLSVVDHDRGSALLRYVYPVVSRRSRGVSVGINLNPNNACNFRCVYCQVPDLVMGSGPEIDLEVLGGELRCLLDNIINGDFLTQRVEAGVALKDVAFSGNGEPTSSPQFLACVKLLEQILSEFDLLGRIDVVLITNGTLTERPQVARGIERIAAMSGHVWFKLDSGTRAGAERINGSRASIDARLRRLAAVSQSCPTWVQTCMFAQDGEPPSIADCDAYIAALRESLRRGATPLGVLLYGLARQSMQPEANRLQRLDADWLEAMAERIRDLGIEVRVTP